MRRVAVLGTGIIAAAMARNLTRSGLDVVVWNRSPGRVEPLAADGVRVAGRPAEASAGVDAVVTMLRDGASVAEVMTAALPTAADGVLWAQMSTASLQDADTRLPALADKYAPGTLTARYWAPASPLRRAGSSSWPRRPCSCGTS